MFVLVSYDIEKDRTRTRLSKKLADFGPRVQYSVFEGDITKSEMERLLEVLAKVSLGENDSIRMYTLCKECKSNIKLWGKGEITEDKEYYIV